MGLWPGAARKELRLPAGANAGAGQPLVCPSDQISSPGYGPDVARAAVILAEERLSGLIHVVGPEVLDRVAFARADRVGLWFRPQSDRIPADRRVRSGRASSAKRGIIDHTARREAAWIMRPLAAALADFRDMLRRPGAPGLGQTRSHWRISRNRAGRCEQHRVRPRKSLEINRRCWP